VNIQMNAVTSNFLSLLKLFVQSRFKNIGDRDNDFQQMSNVGNKKCPQPLSDKFILELTHALQSNITMHDRLRLMFVDGKYLEKADQLHWEFTRIPVIFEYHEPVTWMSGSRELGSAVFDHFQLRIEASKMPHKALPYGIKTLADVPYGFVVCFFELSQINDLKLPFMTHFWKDRDIVKALHKISEFEILEEEDTTSAQQQLESPVERTTYEQQQMTTTEKVYNFIAINSPTTSHILLEQGFCEKRRLYYILQSLCKEKKITNPKRGIYKIANY